MNEWFHALIDFELIAEALELIGYQKKDIEFSGTQVISKDSRSILFSGDNLSDLFGLVISESDIYIEF